MLRWSNVRMAGALLSAKVGSFVDFLAERLGPDQDGIDRGSGARP
jgi:hypothetical protein